MTKIRLSPMSVRVYDANGKPAFVIHKAIKSISALLSPKF